MKMKNPGIIAVGALALAMATGLAWRGGVVQAQSAATPATRIAVVDTIALVEKLMASDRYKPARDQFTEDQKAKEGKIIETFQTMQAEAQKKAEEAKTDDEKSKIQADTGAKGEELKAQYQALQGEGDQFSVNQLADAYAQVIRTSGEIAGKRGYTHVLSSRLGEIPRDKGFQTAFQEILLRHTAVIPAGDDITDAVIKELKLDEVPAPAPAPAGDAAPEGEETAAPKVVEPAPKPDGQPK